ncbi:MAG: dehydrogenase [Gammaproteobacteria bacterium CG_4_10_14_0_8_um_filter_38_16]|nr:MAG: dehydrogenase [Gammaproteobacteria bacterium CG_4_10_14_0_8_um_filter_38_16]PJA02786.1 MAG: dehydrogenase [Gammaproteobacteria bacterium CG_4_10_14_0_2_um_filter_38_22]PJB10723.1 MAG: dehydrogenase [Gammaproteobacteria bacterium CG_4_9_14_3_um_filter_38_9]
MQQLLQSLQSGEIAIVDVPCPQNKDQHLLVKTTCSLISSGTERMLMDFGRAGLLGKIKQQPDKVAQVLSKIKTDGLVATLEAVKSKLDQPITLGYCQVGMVHSLGNDCHALAVGDRVVTNGPHAEFVRVPKNLAVKIPDNVTDECAAFSVLGAIALQGIRLANPTLGETVVVIGLGLVGQLTVQLLIAQGCQVLGIDFNGDRCEIAKKAGATIFHLQPENDPCSFAAQFSQGRGVDAVLITASTESDTPIKQAATMCRQRGRIVLVGVTGLTLSRDDFYKKELSFQVSCSYGPGRYDSNYEEKGQDYPIGFVRWTENRNIAAVLDMLSSKRLNVAPLITHRFLFSEVVDAYAILDDKNALGILLTYPAGACHPKNTVALGNKKMNHAAQGAMTLACIGAGNFASRILLPILKKNAVCLHTLITDRGVSGVIHGKKNGFQFSSSSILDTLNENEINTVLIATPHHLHAEQVIAALQKEKNVFVEKPLAITESQLNNIVHVYQALPEKKIIMVGFNRRFSPFIQKMKQLLSPLHEPKNIIMTVNAGFIPKTHWIQDANIGGGRLIGEVCHFVDLLRYIADSPIVNAQVSELQNSHMLKNENVIITLQFQDGSQGAIHYFANGQASFPKERLEVFCAGKILSLDNFRKLKGFGFKQFKKQSAWRQQKGHPEMIQAFVTAVESGGVAPIPMEEIIEVSSVCLALNKKVV